MYSRCKLICFQFQVWFILCYATNIGLISAQISSPDEVKKILGFHPDHVCHCTCIHPLHESQELWGRPTLPNSCIPVVSTKLCDNIMLTRSLNNFMHYVLCAWNECITDTPRLINKQSQRWLIQVEYTS